ncbi:MAG: protein kinase, partial [Planctomycetota bacterium]
HIPKQQLERLLNGEHELDEEHDAHLEACAECQRTLDAIAAAPKIWDKASELIAEPLMSELAVRRATASYGSKYRELESDPDHDMMSRDSAEYLLDRPSHPEMLGRIGDYDVEREVGRGGMGIVFKAFDSELHRPVAVKVLAPWLAQNGTARKRFAREARAAAAVIHPNVIAIYGVNASKKTPFLVMPFVAGPSLQHLIDEHGPLDEKDVVRIGMQVSAGLGAAHVQGLVHRDIKPANILVEPEVSRVLVTDFGLARAVDDASATHSGYFVGTPNYMSPEQSKGRRVDNRSDLFSLGSVMYFMATGRMPFRAESPLCILNRISNDEPTGIQQINSDMSRTLSDIVEKLLEKNPEDRFQSAGEVHEVLEKYLAYLHQPDVSKPPKIALKKRNTESRSHSWLYAIATVGVLAAIMAFGLARGWLPAPSWMASTPTKSAGDNGGWNESDEQRSKPGKDLEAGKDSAAGAVAGSWNSDADESATKPSEKWGEKSESSAPKLGGSGDWQSSDSDSAKKSEIIGDEGVPGEFVTVIESLGKNIDGYTIYLPDSYSDNAALYPVIIYLQGAFGVGGEVSRVNKWGLPKLVSDLREVDSDLRELVRDRFIIVSPHIKGGDYFDDVMATKKILKEVTSRHRVDLTRVYLTGLSHGGAGTWGIASRLEDTFAAAAPLAGQVYGVKYKSKLAKTPMWVAHNTKDNFAPVATVVSKLNKLSKTRFKSIDASDQVTEEDLEHKKILMTEKTDDHDAWSRVYVDPQFYRWLLRHDLRRW